MVQNLEVVSPLDKSDHCGLMFDFISSDRLNTTEERSRVKMDYFKQNYDLVRCELEVVNWNEIFESYNV